MEVAAPAAAAAAAPGTTPNAAASINTAHTNLPEEDTSAFECNVCLELAKEPVVTLCGHLYCWPCLYRWTHGQCYARGAPMLCPVCKASVKVDKVIPIYGRGCDIDPREALKEEPVPPRPAGQRPPNVQPPTISQQQIQQQQQQQQQQQSLSTLLGLNWHTGYVDLTPEQQQQVYLSRLLLIFGSFVIMCLLLF